MLDRFENIFSLEVESTSLKEYINFKNDNPDYLILFQIGAFYETFFEDAKIFSEITGSALGVRRFKTKIEVAESGIPKDKLNIYLKSLLNNGLKICVCSEYANNNGEHYREITRKYTQGTILEDEFLESNENNYIASIYKKNDNYNLAYADVSTGQIYKTKCDLKNYKTELDKISPKEIIIAKHQEKIFKNISTKYNITYLSEDYFKDNVENAIEKYCLETQKKYKSKLDKIIEYQCTSFMSLDEITRKNLEFTRTNYLLKKKGSILWFLNYTKTPMGIRLLKKFLNEPLLSLDEIKIRQDAIEELTSNSIIIDKLQNILEQFSDLARMCSKLSNITVLPKDLVNLARNSALLPELKNIIDSLKSKLFKLDSNKLDKIVQLSNTIKLAIKEDCNNDLKSGNLINDNYSAQLDYLKSELNKAVKQITKYEIQQRKIINTDSLSIQYSSQVGYYIQIPAKQNINIPKNYYKKHSTNKFYRYTSEELNQLQENINSIKYEINELEYEIFKEIRLLSNNFVESIRALSKNIALIDVIVSFAKCAVENNLVKPEISGSDLIIKNGYHPSLIKLNNEIVKNDTNIKQGSIMVLTGANMSGKSTYLKHNAIICILAQIGSFVPADYTKLPLINKIFYRQGSTDDIINNNSSFMVEMNDLKYIIDNITSSSLVLLDEPAKSTNAKESGAISKAFCEYLLKNYKAYTIIATHNIELTTLENKYPNIVTNYVIGNTSDTFNRKIKKGYINKTYALETAVLADLPDEIIKLAKGYID